MSPASQKQSKPQKITKVLIANRGEIAVRILRACKELDIKTVAIYSEVDAQSAHVLLADEAYCLGEAEASKSYLNLEKLKQVIQTSGCDAIHPGFGFYAENAPFARLCADLGVIFIGPSPEVIDALGDKVKARAIMQKAGVPIVPGSPGPVTTLAEAKKVANEIGFPLLIKAAAGGGGKGMRLITKHEELDSGFVTTQREAKSYFGNEEVFLERFVTNPHHIEVQIIADSYGNVSHLFERECSLQRRHQKVIEEAPAPLLVGKDAVREKLFQVAVQGAQSVGYVNAGTMEFIMDEAENFYFLEMNTRIQVEHPVSEWITSTDIVKEQIRIAQGEKLSQEFLSPQARGHSIECRLYAEDSHTFLPKPGRVSDTWFPAGPFVRVDSALLNKQQIPIEYDPMIAKISVWGKDRAEALARMRRALEETLVAGTVTNLSFLRKTLRHPVFSEGIYTTNFIKEQEALTAESSLAAGVSNEEQLAALLATVAQAETNARNLLPAEPAPWCQNEQEVQL